MTVLDAAMEWSLKHLKDEDTISILLVGSWARGEGSDTNDIYVILIKQHQLIAIAHQEQKLPECGLDIWTYDKHSIENDIFGIAEDLNQVNNTSMILSFAKDAVIWFQSEPFLEKIQEKISSWRWEPSYSAYMDFPNDPPTLTYLRNAYEENVQLLLAAKSRLQQGKPISHRKKDYPELIEEKSEEHALLVSDLTETAYLGLGIERHWTEFDDGRKAVKTQNWGIAVVSFKDVLRFIIRYQLPSVPDQLLDPSIWKSVENMTLPEDLITALKAAYS